MVKLKDLRSVHLSLELDNNKVSYKKKVLPLICNESLCVNPAHLVTGATALFYMKITKLSEKEGGCWVWNGALDKAGYGALTISEPERRTIKAHRYSWYLYIGRMPPACAQVCHKCDHPYCVNPYHLFLGENQDNIDDKVLKGRALKKLEPNLIREIKTLFLNCKSQSAIAKQFNVSRGTISNIKEGKVGKNIVITYSPLPFA